MWATERQGYPIKDVAFSGGWRTERTILSSYQQDVTARLAVWMMERMGFEPTTPWLQSRPRNRTSYDRM